MEIGGEISRCPIKLRDPEDTDGLNKLKKIINKSAANIARQYIQEVLPHLSITNDEINKLFELVNSNIIPKSELKNICVKFNGNDASCYEKDCRTCQNKHIFCELYKIGLIGYVEPDPVLHGSLIQKFNHVGEHIFDDVRSIPDSDYYLLHPILDELVRQKNYLYKHNINSINIAGYNKKWRIETSYIEPIHSPTIFISSTLDLSTYREIAYDVVVNEFSYKAIMSEFVNSHDTLKTFKRYARESDIFIIIIGKRYGQKYKGKSICEHEVNSAFDNNPKKIIVYVDEGKINEWDSEQQKFLNTIQQIDKFSFARGSRISPVTLKARLKKDLTEKITNLMRNK